MEEDGECGTKKKKMQFPESKKSKVSEMSGDALDGEIGYSATMMARCIAKNECSHC